ncbi:hypothetical protein FC65_GL001038 [Ligilactobacillus acidipiscis DSM 15836]|uniref:Tetratricopeptide repeat protein n=1 Tax=Ligilactobacillus acidipiscis DSM 15836 TaxID=1423716 RepID=A0ABR5PI00_9LACO|nr:tetratricopeptide repeat protein [Ligilactobacillus acidipiscis]KRM20640.1 hypothetical protein FC65_GL001038 [Ligilactobacillus acidipiscis DSM 15836]GAW63520.1 hypothetical protein Lacidipiscis_00703 [Ligilactobacillus acidipiscis]GEN21940.1 hypothetical protein LAC02_52210 [Ligilactobacillus acidipiscis]
MSYSEETLANLELGQIEEAKKKFAWALRKDDDDTLFSLAEELYSLGFSSMSKRTYHLLLERYPNEDELRTALADIAISEGQDDQALNYLSEIKATSPAYLEALLVEADLYQTQGLFEVSEQKLLTASQIAPDEEVIQFALAELYFSIKEYRKAANYYLSLIKQGIQSYSKVNIVGRLGVSYAEIGKFEQALGYLEQIHEKDLDPDTRFQLAVTQYQLHHEDDALRNFNKLKETDPDYATIYPYIAKIYENKGQFGDALITLQDGLSVDQYNIALYQDASRVAQKLGQDEDAENYLRTALDQDPDNLTLVIDLSNLLVRLGRHQENLDLIQTYQKQDQSDARLLWNQGRSFAALDNYSDAINDYEAAYAELNTAPDFLSDAAVFFRNAGHRQQAINCAKAYLTLYPNDPDMNQFWDEIQE